VVFLIVARQLTNVKGMMELKNHYFSTTILTICRQKSSMNEDSGR
jgi:hypothetical protein